MFKGQASELQFFCKQVISAETYDVKLLRSLHHHLMRYSVKRIKHKLLIWSLTQKLHPNVQLDFSLCLVTKALEVLFNDNGSFYHLFFYTIQWLL